MLHLFRERGAEDLAMLLCEDLLGMDAAVARCGRRFLHRMLDNTDKRTCAIEYLDWHYEYSYERISAKYTTADSDDYLILTIEIETDIDGVINHVQVLASGMRNGEYEEGCYEDEQA